VTETVVVSALPMATLSTAILVVNNVRDLETDRETGKRTLAVRLGYGPSRAEYLLCLLSAYAVPVVLWVDGGLGVTILAPLVTAPYAALVARTVLTETGGDALNPALEQTGRLLATYAALFAAGTVV
jgi:1,4-dihydroxy-2-naphtoate prenyltransferase (EC 2.5.1.-)